MADFILGIVTGMLVGSCSSLVLYALIFANAADRDLEQMHRAFEEKKT